MTILRLFLLLLSTSCTVSAFYDSSETKVEVIASYDEFESKVIQDDFFWVLQFYHPTKHGSAMSGQSQVYGEISTVLKGIVHFGAVDISTDDGARIAVAYKIQLTKDIPTIIILTEDKWKPVETMTKEVQTNELLHTVVTHTSNVLKNRIEGNGGGGGLDDEDDGPSNSSSSSKRKTAFATVTGANFDEMVLNNPQVVLVAFTAHWCGHCKQLEPEFKQAARNLANEEVLLAWVNAEEEEALSATYGVNGFPTLKMFRGGKDKTPKDGKDFMYERSAPSITSAVLEEVGRTGIPKEIPELTSPDVFQEECQGSNRICVLAALPHILDSGAEGRNKYRDLLSSVSKSFKGVGAFSFLWFEGGGESQPGVEKAFDLTFGFPALVAYSMDRKAYAVLHGSFSEKQIAAFLHGITTGRQATIKIDEVPKVQTVEPWDGEDGAPIEEEFDLSELYDEGEL